MPNDKPISELELPAWFPENSVPAAPLADSRNLPTPQSLAGLIPLPDREVAARPRVLIVDDEEAVIDGLARSWKQYYPRALDVRFWQAGAKPGLVEQIELWIAEGWRPDAAVIDINMDDGGRHGVDYLGALRSLEGCQALPVVLATGNQYRDLDESRLTIGKNLTPDNPAAWARKAQVHEPEAILYGKTADALFLGRIGEHLPEWRNAARRRAWIALLNRVAPLLDGASIKVATVAEEVTRFAVAELQVDDAFVRWREEGKPGHDGHYEVVARESTRVSDARRQHYTDDHHCIDPEDVPILKEILDQSREPVFRERLTKDEAGIFKDAIAGCRFLGVGLVLGDKPVGFISLLRNPDGKPFSTETDGRYLSVLARLLASALGRDRLMRVRQTVLLEFSTQVAVALSKPDVCKSLAEFLQRELHDDDAGRGKVTVRLLDFGTGLLIRRAHVGMSAESKDIFIADHESIYAECVRENRLRRIEDVCDSKWNGKYTELCKETRSELCLPLGIGNHAIGGVNLEHKIVDFYREHDEDFVKAAAGLAASAIERIGNGELLNGMAEFVHRFWTDDTALLKQRLKDLLYEFSGYSVLVTLARHGDHEDWSVADLECRLQGAEADGIRQQIETAIQDRFHETWFGKMCQTEHWRADWADYTEEEFMPVDLVPSSESPMQQRADALLWLRRDAQPPHQALILMWGGLPPPINAAGIVLLGNLARLFSELDSRRQNVEDMRNQYLLRAQAAEIGHVMQHFRHRLGNLTGSQATHITLVEQAHQDKDEEAFAASMQGLKANARDIANSYSKSKAYIKKIEQAATGLSAIVDRAVGAPELKVRLEALALHVKIDAALKVQTDCEVAALVLYSLLENALDALQGRNGASIEIRGEARGGIVVLTVADNGPGVSVGFRRQLFAWGATTKSNGLGSALAFARTRMELMGAALVFPPDQPSQGAVFEMRFPLAGA
jgi:signal transduction histidine kinase/CheY-like chemotaxis protein